MVQSSTTRDWFRSCQRHRRRECGSRRQQISLQALGSPGEVLNAHFCLSADRNFFAPISGPWSPISYTLSGRHCQLMPEPFNLYYYKDGWGSRSNLHSYACETIGCSRTMPDKLSNIPRCQAGSGPSTAGKGVPSVGKTK